MKITGQTILNKIKSLFFRAFDMINKAFMFLAEIGKEARELRATFLTRQISLFVIWLIAALYRGKLFGR